MKRMWAKREIFLTRIKCEQIRAFFCSDWTPNLPISFPFSVVGCGNRMWNDILQRFLLHSHLQVQGWEREARQTALRDGQVVPTLSPPCTGVRARSSSDCSSRWPGSPYTLTSLYRGEIEKLVRLLFEMARLSLHSHLLVQGWEREARQTALRDTYLLGILEGWLSMAQVGPLRECPDITDPRICMSVLHLVSHQAEAPICLNCLCFW